MIRKNLFICICSVARSSSHLSAALCLIIVLGAAYLGAPQIWRKEIAQSLPTAVSFFTFNAPAHAADSRDYPVRDYEAYQDGGEGENTGEGEGNGIGGTGYKPGPGEGNGIGGTGRQANENGIGGTGIIGAITGFGSIFVNGYEVEISDNMPIAFKDKQTTPERLSIGQVVEIEATGDGTHVKAASVRVRHELGGTIEHIDNRRRLVTILGQNIQLAETTNGLSEPNGVAFENLSVGDRVDVSGFRRADGTIEATRLDPLPVGDPDHLIGTVKRTGNGTVTVSGLALTADTSSGRSADIASLEDGSEIRIVGHWGGRRFRAHRIRAHARWRFSNRVRRLAIEGYIRRGRGGAYVLDRYRLNRSAAAFRQRMILTGRLDARHRFIENDVRAARLLKRRGRRIRALRRNFRQHRPPRLHRQWRNRPPEIRKRIWRKPHRERRMRHQRRRRN